MADQPEISHFLRDLFPEAGPDLLRLLQGATDNAYLLRSDLYALRDFADIARCGRDEVYALLLLLLVALEEGSLCIEAAAPPLLRRLRDFVPENEAAAWADRIIQAVNPSSSPALIGTSADDHKPVILHTSGARRYLYFQKYLRAELDFQRALQTRLQSSSGRRDVPWSRIMGDVLAESPIALDPEQQLALKLALEREVAIISGGPGTGKTSIVLAMLRCLLRAGVPAERIALAAPTGRAAQRLSDRTRAANPLLAATTLHQLLGYRPSRNTFSRHCENSIDADVVIVDEVSMVGVVLMAQLLQALAPGTKLVLLGDKDQLPSVEAGAVLAHLVSSDLALKTGADEAVRNPVVVLQTNHRSQEQIREAARAINSQDADVIDRLPRGEGNEAWWCEIEKRTGCWFLEQIAASAPELRSFLQPWAQQAYLQGEFADTIASLAIDVRHAEDARIKALFGSLDRFRLLTLVRDGAWGCDDINYFLAHWLRPRLGVEARGHLFAGAPVLITRNDPARGLYNGDVGITVRCRNGGLAVLFERDPGHVAIPVEALPAHELGFALTVHKSQGSEYARVMVVLPPTGGRRLLTKELLYTGITRAKSLAIICGTREVVRLAVERRIVRESGFGQ